MNRAKFLGFGFGLVLVSGGCGDGWDLSFGGDGGGDVDVVVSPECKRLGAPGKVDDAVRIVDDFGASLHEMVACGGLTYGLCVALVFGVSEAISQGRDGATPEDWQFDGDGLYTTSAAAAAMTNAFYLGRDTSFGAAGDLLTENVFLVETYLVGARIEFTTAAQDEGYIHFDAPGPYAELLGYGPQPQSPIPIDLNDPYLFQDGLEAVLFESRFTVDSLRDETTIHYEVETDQFPVASMLGGEAVAFQIQTVSATRASLDQELTVDDWNVAFVSGYVGALDGSVEFRVDGGPFPYRGEMTFDKSRYPSAVVECP